MNVLLALLLIGISTVVVADEPLKRAPRGCFPSLSSPDTMDHLQTHRPPPEARMDCPKDRTPLEVVHFHSIPIHRCPKCEGTWYETDQLRILKDKEAHGNCCWINLDLWRDTAKFRAASSSRYTCPADSTPLIPVHYGNTIIVADICQTCQGVWLDKGEYARIIKFLADAVDAQSVGDYLSDLRDEFGEIVRGHPLAGLKGIEKVLYLLELRFFVQHPQLLRGVQSLPRA